MKLNKMAALRPEPPANYCTKINGEVYSLEDRHSMLLAVRREGDTTLMLRVTKRLGVGRYFTARCTPVGGVFDIDIQPVSAEQARDIATEWGQPLPPATPDPDTERRVRKLVQSAFHKE
jgi:hypothetical protein